MATLDWSGCPLVEVIPGKVSGAPLLKNTRLPVDAITGNYDAFRDEGCRRTRLSLKRWIVTLRLASTLSRRSLPIAPRANFRPSFEGILRRG
jgi:hypothetical protein